MFESEEAEGGVNSELLICITGLTSATTTAWPGTPYDVATFVSRLTLQDREGLYDILIAAGACFYSPNIGRDKPGLTVKPHALTKVSRRSIITSWISLNQC